MTELELALSYARMGVKVFPCRSEDEVTDDYDPDTGEIIVLKAKTPLLSNGFKGATNNIALIERMFPRFPGAMVGIPTGEQLGAWVLDVDVHKDDDGNVINGYEALAALEDKYGPLPETATARTAGGGEHRYFKHASGVRNRGKLGAGLDVRGSGGYVIAPGSRTADGKEYTWIDYDGDGLPPLADAPEWLLSLVLPPPLEQSIGRTDYPDDGVTYTEIRELLSYISPDCSYPDWISVLMAIHSAFGTEGLSIAEDWSSGGKKFKRGEIARKWKGFKDTGGVSIGSLCELARQGGADLSDIARRNHGWQSYDNTPAVDHSGMIANGLAKREKVKRGSTNTDTIKPQPVSSGAEIILDTESDALPVVIEHEEDDHVLDYKLEAISDLEALTRPGGLVEDIIDWIVSSAEQPCRALALAAALPLVASLAGSRFSTGSRDTRPNIYTVALAESGFGKEHARSQIKRLLMASRGVFEKFGGPARIMSASALREVLEENQSVNCQIDEFGGFMRNITDRKASSHQQAISTDLRDYYSASSTYFEGAAYRGSPPKRIYNPNLCIHGTSTPDQFWSALSSASAEDGLLPRLVLFHVTGAKPEAVKPKRDVRWEPHDILMKMADVAGIDVAKTRGNLGKKVKVTPFAENKPYVVPWTGDALGLFASVKESIDERSRKVQPESRPFMQRILENAIKLALIVAVGTNPHEPKITEEIIEWAATLSWTCAAAMLAEVEDRLSDNQREANYKRIAGIVRAAGKKGITRGRLADRIKAIDARQREEILKDLMSAGKVIETEIETKGRKSRRLVWC